MQDVALALTVQSVDLQTVDLQPVQDHMMHISTTSTSAVHFATFYQPLPFMVKGLLFKHACMTDVDMSPALPRAGAGVCRRCRARADAVNPHAPQ